MTHKVDGVLRLMNGFPAQFVRPSKEADPVSGEGHDAGTSRRTAPLPLLAVFLLGLTMLLLAACNEPQPTPTTSPTPTPTSDPTPTPTGGPIADLDIDVDADTIWQEVAVGETVEGAIPYEGDFGHFAFAAQKGETYQIDVAVGTLSGPFIEVLGLDGALLARGEYHGDFPASRFVWQAPASGEYHAAVSGDDTGTYTLTISVSTSVEVEITACEISHKTSSGPIKEEWSNVTMEGVVHAHRDVSNLVVIGHTSGSSFWGREEIGSLAAGQSRRFSLGDTHWRHAELDSCSASATFSTP